MSEWTTGQPRSSESQYANRQPPDPAVAAVDAFRAAIVAQTALLRSISEQIRLGQAATNGALDGLASTVGHFYGDSGEALAGLAERLGSMERDLHALLPIEEAFCKRLAALEARQENILGQIRTANQAYSDGMQSKPNQSLTSKKSKHVAARRKAKR